MTKGRRHGGDLRAASKLAVEATRSVTTVIEDMHRTLASGPALLGSPLALPARALTALVYGHIRGVTGLVGAGLDLLLAQLEPLLGESAPGPQREAVLSVLNGVVGDYLAATKNPLAIEMELRTRGQPLPLETTELRRLLPHATGKLLVLVHGSSMSDLGWRRAGHDHGEALARDLGFTPVHVRYNSGLHISTNGRELAEKLEQLVSLWPTEVVEVSFLGHSMGGLVVRSACHVATKEGLRWRTNVRRLLSLGTPHHGSPLERGGNIIEGLLGAVTYSAPLARLAQIRSRGVTDLRFGNVLDEDWADGASRKDDRRAGAPLPEGVDCYAIAGTTAKVMRAKLPGDGLVPVDSALGRHRQGGLTLRFPEEHQWIALGAGHLELLSSPAVYQRIRTWFA